MMKKKIFFAVIVAALMATSCLSQEVASAEQTKERAVLAEPAEGETALIDITMEGGSGKASVQSPVEVTTKNGVMTARLVWSSRNYDYMVVDGIRYENENAGGESTFTVPVAALDEPMTVIADTLAMSTPHEIEYVITWQAGSEERDTEERDAEKEIPQTQADSGEEKGQTEAGSGEEKGQTQAGSEEGDSSLQAKTEEALEKAGITCSGELAAEYAARFRVRYYGAYTVIAIDNSGIYLLVPEGGDVPEGIPDETVILEKPLDRTYLVSTSVMDLLRACGALDRVRLSGTKESDWYIDEAISAMHSGGILYAGKYRAPDYERILAEGCDLAIENTMIYHEPAVKAKLEELGIPVLVETSSYEPHPLGRLEWIRLYGILFDREEEADEWFREQLQTLEILLKEKPDTGKSAAFFYVAGNGMINVRRPGDYITRMIELSGGRYILPDTEENDNTLSTMNMQMEDFYAAARDADVILYNSTIGGEIASVQELVKMNPLFQDFRAVKEGQVYCVERGFFQHTTGMAEFIKDLCSIWEGDGESCRCLKKLD